MRHNALSVVQPLCLGHSEFRSEYPGKIKNCRIHDSGIPVGPLPHVAPEPNGLSCGELCDCRLLQLFGRKIDIFDGSSFRDVAKKLDRQAAVVGFVRRRRVDQTDILRKLHPDVFLVKRFWSQVLVPVEFIILIPVLERERLRRFSQAYAEHVVDRVQHSILHLEKLLKRDPALMRRSENTRVLPQFLRHICVHLSRCGGGGAFRVNILRNKSVFFHQIAKHVPLSAIVERRAEEMRDQPSVGRLVQRLQYAFQKIVCLFQFIVKERISLGQFEVFKIQRLHDADPHRV